MAATTANAHTSGAASASGGGFLHRLVEGWREHRRYQRTVAELDALTDRELADIGLSRSEVDMVARRCARAF
jgi:uncharacterized protein YjiS (DUF1127 family)